MRTMKKKKFFLRFRKNFLKSSKNFPWNVCMFPTWETFHVAIKILQKFEKIVCYDKNWIDFNPLLTA